MFAQANAVPAKVVSIIQDEVEALGERKNLKVLPWYHDLPVWLLRRDDPSSEVVRRLQVAVYNVGDGLEVQIIPSAYRVDRENKIRHEAPLTRSRRGSSRLAVGVWSHKGEAEVREQFRSSLERGWEYAEKISVEWLTEQTELP